MTPPSEPMIPSQLGRAELRDGYLKVLNELHEPDAFFDRLDALYLDGPLAHDHGRTARLPRASWPRVVEQAKLVARAFVLLGRITLLVPDAGLRRIYFRRADSRALIEISGIPRQVGDISSCFRKEPGRIDRLGRTRQRPQGQSLSEQPLFSRGRMRHTSKDSRESRKIGR